MPAARASFQLVNSLSAGLIAGIRTVLGSASMVVLVMPNALPGGIAPALEVILIGGAVIVGAIAIQALFSASRDNRHERRNARLERSGKPAFDRP